jgi:hypothetical protein
MDHDSSQPQHDPDGTAHADAEMTRRLLVRPRFDTGTWNRSKNIRTRRLQTPPNWQIWRLTHAPQ